MFAPWAETYNQVWIWISKCCIMQCCHCQLLHRGPSTIWYSIYTGHSCPGFPSCLFASLELGCEACTMLVVATTFVFVLLLLVFWSSPMGHLIVSGSRHVCYWFEPSGDVGLGRKEACQSAVFSAQFSSMLIVTIHTRITSERWAYISVCYATSSLHLS